MLGRSALLAASGSLGYGNWLGNYSNVSLLLRNGVPSASVFVANDESLSPKQVIAFGNATTTTSIAKYGNSSLMLDGSGDWFGLGTGNAAYAFGSGDFTVEAWVYRLSTQTGIVFTGQGDNATVAGSSYVFYVSESATSDLYVSTTAYSVTSPNPSINQWSHVAWTRQGGVFRSFLNGVIVGINSGVSAGSVNTGASTYQAAIGGSANGANSIYGYIDDLRITKGIARYTSAFTPPAAELPASVTDDPSYNNVSLLLRNAIPKLIVSDESATARPVVMAGTIAVTTSVLKYGSSCIYFSGAGGNVLTVTAGSDFAPSTGDFTVEAWVYFTGSSDGIIFGQTVSGTNYFVLTVNSTGAGFIATPSGGGTSISGPTGFSMSNRWRHVAVTRASGIVRVFVDGQAGTPTSNTTNLANTTYTPTIGAYSHNTSQLVFSGYIDDLRYTKGVARYIKNFLPPPAELPNF